MNKMLYIEIGLTAIAFGSLIAYHLWHFLQIKHNTLMTDIGRNNQVRAKWVRMIMAERRDILAVQTLRNWTMAATFLASTAILVSLGALNVALSTEKMTEVSDFLNLFGSHHVTLWATKLLILAIAFFFAFFNFTLAVRYYNHVGFMINVPAESDGQTASQIAGQIAIKILNRGAMHYHLGMRAYYIAIPLTLWLLGPTWLVLGSLVLTFALYRLDRAS